MKKIIKLAGVLMLFGWSTLCWAEEEGTKDFLPGGNFENTGYKGRGYTGGSVLQPDWDLYPFQDTGGYKITGEPGEAYEGKYCLHVQYAKAPNAPTGWTHLCCMAKFSSVPNKEFNVSIAVRGKGKASVVIAQYAIQTEDGKKKEIFKGSLGKMDAVEAQKEWKIYKFQCQAPGENIGLVKAVVNFLPADDGTVDIFIDDVKVGSGPATAEKNAEPPGK